MGVHCEVDLISSATGIDEDAQLDTERTLLEYHEYMLNELEKQIPNIIVTKCDVDVESGEVRYDMLVKHSKPIERIQLNFVAEKTGVKFSEIIDEKYLD